MNVHKTRHPVDVERKQQRTREHKRNKKLKSETRRFVRWDIREFRNVAKNQDPDALIAGLEKLDENSLPFTSAMSSDMMGVTRVTSIEKQKKLRKNYSQVGARVWMQNATDGGTVSR